MIINVNKTKCMQINPKKKTKDDSSLDIKLYETKISEAKTEKLLGIILDNSLSWKDQINETKRKIHSKLAILRRIKKYLPSHIRQAFYNYHILPVMEYCNILWATPFIYVFKI